MMPTKPTCLLAVAAASLSLLLAACGGGPERAGEAGGNLEAPAPAVGDQAGQGAVTQPPAPVALLARDPGLMRVGDWLVVCLAGDPASTVPWERRTHCRIEKPDFAAVATVDARGPLIITSRPAPGGCDGYARHAGVDGEAIEMLLPRQKLHALKTGEVFAREFQGPVPPCRKGIEKTGLTGFGQAYEAMLARWEAFRSPAGHAPAAS